MVLMLKVFQLKLNMKSGKSLLRVKKSKLRSIDEFIKYQIYN